MTPKEIFEQVHREVRAINRLLDKPEWGLLSFNSMLANHLTTLNGHLMRLGIVDPVQPVQPVAP